MVPISSCMQAYVLIVSHVSHQFIHTVNLGGYYNYHPHLTNEEMMGKVEPLH